MNQDLYNIVVTGIVDGHEHEAVQLKLAKILHLEPEEVSKLFIKPTIVKHACAQSIAESYQNKLTELGVACHIELENHNKQE
jgi:hypothetical protein